ncbi:MAG: glycosyltransferase [Verrucomicrobiales bacterium]|nr:glycosyltransferase [Verrucomicrobiales bacterium]MCP5527566.1 glycosyltransferase [Verrucomicrobiales bacterium]
MNVGRGKIRIDFCDFFPGFAKTDNFFYHLLKEHFPVELSDQPDFVFFTPYGHQHRLHTGVRIFFSQESWPADYRHCDYSFTCHHADDPRHCRLPLYVLYGRAEDVIKSPDEAEATLEAKTKFCAFVVGNHHPRKNRNRVAFFERLSARKHVDSGGRFRNNIGGPIPGYSAGKIAFLRQYKFNIAFENASLPGYTTEKIFEAMRARCVPIYWGDPRIAEDFNPKSFINAADFPSLEALADHVIELDRDDTRMFAYLREPYLPDNRPTKWFDRTRLLDQFERIFTTPITPVGHRRHWWHLGRWRCVKRNQLLVGAGRTED